MTGKQEVIRDWRDLEDKWFPTSFRACLATTPRQFGESNVLSIKMKARQMAAPAVTRSPAMPTKPFTIASVAGTLADLKKMPIKEQSLLLLKRLIHIEPQVRGTGGFNKHNFTMAGDSYGLAAGFSDAENEAVRHHLLGVRDFGEISAV